MHYYQMNIGDYAKSTAHLSLYEDLAYRRLLDRYYDTEQPLELDIDKLCRFIRMREYKTETQAVLEEFFQKTQKGWTQKRVKKELDRYSAKADAARVNGKKGGRPKKTQSVNLANPELTQEKAKQEPITNNHKTDKTIDESAINHEFDLVWDLYGKKGNKKTSLNRFKKLSKEKRLLLSNHITPYVLSTPEKQYRKNLETYINQECWNDEVQTDGTKNQPGKAAAGHKLSVVDRTRIANEKRERDRQAREGDGSPMVEAPGDLWPPAEQPVRGDNSGELGETLDGSFTRADS